MEEVIEKNSSVTKILQNFVARYLNIGYAIAIHTAKQNISIHLKDVIKNPEKYQSVDTGFPRIGFVLLEHIAKSSSTSMKNLSNVLNISKQVLNLNRLDYGDLTSVFNVLLSLFVHKNLNSKDKLRIWDLTMSIYETGGQETINFWGKWASSWFDNRQLRQLLVERAGLDPNLPIDWVWELLTTVNLGPCEVTENYIEVTI